MIVQRAVAGDTVRSRKAASTAPSVHGRTLIDDPVHLEVTRADKRLAVGDGELVKRLAVQHADGISAGNDAGTDLVKNTLGKDRIVWRASIGNIEQFLMPCLSDWH